MPDRAQGRFFYPYGWAIQDPFGEGHACVLHLYVYQRLAIHQNPITARAFRPRSTPAEITSSRTRLPRVFSAGFCLKKVKLLPIFPVLDLYLNTPAAFAGVFFEKEVGAMFWRLGYPSC